MASALAHIGLHQQTLETLQQTSQFEEAQFREYTAGDFKEILKNLDDYKALLIGEEIANPIRFAQDVFARDKNLSVLMIIDKDNYVKVKQALQFSPFIGPTIQCISNETGQRMAPILEDAMQRTTQRRSFAKIKSLSISEQQFTPNAFSKVRADFTNKILQEAPIGAILVSGTGIIYNVNNYALNVFSKTEKEILSTDFSELFPEHLKYNVKNFLLTGYQNDEKQVFEISENGAAKYLEVTVAPISMESTSNYKIVLLDDTTATVLAQQSTQAHLAELEKLNENLERVNRDLDIFIYTASHDLKSPILNIEGLVTSLEYELGESRSAVELELDHIKRSISRFKKTVEELTEVSRIQRSFEQEASVVHVKELVDEVQQLLEHEIKTSGATITYHASEELTIRFHKKNLTSIFYNLIGNALKYRSPERKPEIEIKAWKQHDSLYFTVQDNGLGIPEAKRDRVFQLFKRMHSHIEGSGVGLYIVKRIVENNGGRITVDSQEGVRTTFTVEVKSNPLS